VQNAKMTVSRDDLAPADSSFDYLFIRFKIGIAATRAESCSPSPSSFPLIFPLTTHAEKPVRFLRLRIDIKCKRDTLVISG
jgi:hypothetical protein